MRFACVLFALFIAMVLPASAQTSGTLSGRVVDSSGGVVPGVTVLARQVERGVERTTLTGSDGRFVLAGLPVGPYTVRVELAAFKAIEQRGILLTVGDAASLNFTLEVGNLTGDVLVVGDASAVNIFDHPELLAQVVDCRHVAI